MLKTVLLSIIFLLQLVASNPENAIGTLTNNTEGNSVVEFQQVLTSLQTYENEPLLKLKFDNSDISAIKATLKKDLVQFPKNATHSIPFFLALVYSGHLNEAKSMYGNGCLDGPFKHIYIKYARDIARLRSHQTLLEWLQPLAHDYESAIWGVSENKDLLIECAKRMDNYTLYNLITRLSKYRGSKKVHSSNLIEIIRQSVTNSTFSSKLMSQIFLNCLTPSYFFDDENNPADVAVMLLQEGYLKPEEISCFVNLDHLIKQGGSYDGTKRWISASKVMKRAGINMEKECFEALLVSLRIRELINEKFYKIVLQFKPPLKDNTPLMIAEERLQDEEIIRDLKNYGFGLRVDQIKPKKIKPSLCNCYNEM